MHHMPGSSSMKRDAKAVADILKILIENEYSAKHVMKVLSEAQDQFLEHTEYTTEWKF